MRRCSHNLSPRKGGSGYKYTIPLASFVTLGEMNKTLDPRGRYDAVMAADDLLQVQPVPNSSDPQTELFGGGWMRVNVHF